MKKTILIVALLVGFVASGIAQSRAIGIRGLNIAEISYQHSLGNSNMLQIDGGLYGLNNNVGIQATAIYNWLFPIDWDYEGSWNWYIGPGASAGIKNDGIFVGVSGMAGIEYNFWFPLQLSVDCRPIIPFLGTKPFVFNHMYAIGARYKF
jgi:hypothetical protein